MANILVVDDSPFERTLLRACLLKWGHRVVEAASGREGLDRALSLRPDVVITDLQMPGVSGLALLRRLRQEGTPSRLILLTGTLNDEVRHAALELHLAGTLTKPVNFTQLAALL